MCGIVGGISNNHFDALKSCLPSMAKAISHRGPDAEGYWFEPETGVALGHRRLSILDLTEAGAQPMISASGRYIIVFNGEIYNHLEIRKILELEKNAPSWRGHSDTESIIAAIEAWGIVKSIEKCRGMFAIAIWDRLEQTLTLIRDRIGEKPIYYCLQKNLFSFASELKALRYSPYFSGTISRDALAEYYRYNCIPDPLCIYENCYKLQAGKYITISLKDIASNLLPDPQEYWSISEAFKKGKQNSILGSEAEHILEFEKILSLAVSEQSIADVPIGAFLSGGIDSSVVVAMMQLHSNKKIKTFNVGFREPEYDESDYAKKIANYLGTDHNELCMTSSDVIDIIEKLPIIYDEPFADSSQIPTFFVSQFASNQVKVVLSGDAGDELFCGYPRYSNVASSWKKIENIPLPIRKFVAEATSFSLSQYLKKNELFALKIKALKQCNLNSFYDVCMTQCADPSEIVAKAISREGMIGKSDTLASGIESLMLDDIQGYLPRDTLVKVDRASMSVSLESRIPFLDLRMIDFSLQLPLNMKYNKGVHKYLVKKYLGKVFPEILYNRPKTGFGVPISKWLRSSLKDWGCELIHQIDAEKHMIDRNSVLRKWTEHQDGLKDWSTHLWMTLAYLAWFDMYQN